MIVNVLSCQKYAISEHQISRAITILLHYQSHFHFLLFTLSSDEEYARRVQMQNEWVVRQVDNMQDYKQSLLFSLAANLEAEVWMNIFLFLFYVYFGVTRNLLGIAF